METSLLIVILSSQQDCISLALRAPYGTLHTCVSEASCPNFEPRAHARLTGLTNSISNKDLNLNVKGRPHPRGKGLVKSGHVRTLGEGVSGKKRMSSNSNFYRNF